MKYQGYAAGALRTPAAGIKKIGKALESITKEIVMASLTRKCSSGLSR